MHKAEVYTLKAYSGRRTKYSIHTLPDRKNYKEILIQTPYKEYVITDVLANGKFKAVEKMKIKDNFDKYIKLVKNSERKTFDIFIKKTIQQGIKLTPEVVAKIKGELLNIKNSGKKFEDNVVGKSKQPIMTLFITASLEVEAKKFKTADEFVKSKNINKDLNIVYNKLYGKIKDYAFQPTRGIEGQRVDESIRRGTIKNLRKDSETNFTELSRQINNNPDGFILNLNGKPVTKDFLDNKLIDIWNKANKPKPVKAKTIPTPRKKPALPKKAIKTTKLPTENKFK